MLSLQDIEKNQERMYDAMLAHTQQGRALTEHATVELSARAHNNVTDSGPDLTMAKDGGQPGHASPEEDELDD